MVILTVNLFNQSILEIFAVLCLQILHFGNFGLNVSVLSRMSSHLIFITVFNGTIVFHIIVLSWDKHVLTGVGGWGGGH